MNCINFHFLIYEILLIINIIIKLSQNKDEIP